MNLLFICSKNQWRSPTAEAIFKNDPLHQARSAGTSPNARIKVSEKLLNWADIIFVMEKKHKQLLNEKFADALTHKTIIILNIPDEYQYMDDELIENIQISVAPYLN